MDLDEYISHLNPEQRAAVEHEGGSLLILAGAGSGKTRVITTKIAYLINKKNYDPRSILAVTFTKKSAREMLDRAILLEPSAQESQIRTFHSFGAWFLRRYAEEAGIDKSFTVYDDDDMVTLVQKARPDFKKQDAASWAHKISLAKDYCLLPDSVELSLISSDPDFPDIYSLYEKKLRATGNVDFGDLIMLPYLVISENENVRRQMHFRYRVIMVDEYQDSNVAQFKLLKALSGVGEGSGTYVCVVGDDDQSIYKFRGAEVQNILSFENEFPDTSLVRLERNYRSTAEILEVSDRVIRNNEDRLGKTLIAERGKGKKPDLIFLPNQDDEARFCAELIQKSHEKGCPYNDWAILYRTNAQSLGFESEFLRRKIPYTVVGSLKFYEREEIKDMLSFLSLAANPRDEIAFRRIVNKPARGIGGVTQEKIIQAGINGDKMKSLIETGIEMAPSFSKKASEGVLSFCTLIKDLDAEITEGNNSKKLSEFLEHIMNRSGLLEYHSAQDEIAGTQRSANMQELANSAVLYPFSRAGLLEFLDHIELDRTLDNAEEENAADSVTLITIHNTKGLEFPRVIITGLENGIFPRNDKNAGELEEERRLFYVGITRAQNELYVTSCGQRRLYGRTEFMEPSVFLIEAGKKPFRVLGKAPRSYEYSVFGRDSEDEYAQDFAASMPDDPLLRKWAVGFTVFHDDYGYGQIIKSEYREDELVIHVSFGVQGIKKFLPAYQGSSLMVVKD